MPAWQAESTIGAAISSVLWQTYSDLELVVVNDGSSDATTEIVEGFGNKVRMVHQEHSGLAAARNLGIASSYGQLVAFCDADDLLFPNHLSALVACHDRSGGIATANAWWFFKGGIHPGRTRHKGRFPRPEHQRRAILEQNFVSIMSVFPRRLHEEIGPFEDGLNGVEDWDFWMRAIFAGYRVIHQSRPTALYRWGAASLSSDLERTDAAVLAVLRRVNGRPDLTSGERRYIDRRLRGPEPRAQARLGDEALRAARYRDAARYYRRAAKLNPSERALLGKAVVTSLAPRLVGPLVRSRQLRIERGLEFDEAHTR
jgi:glycosyltransferase involved in cell wall biosynthesis